MRILSLDHHPFHTLRYALSPSPSAAATTLPFHRGTVDSLPAGIGAIIATSDLQGFADDGDTPLADAAAHELHHLRQAALLPDKSMTACLLAGDLYPRADVGDVRAAWRRFGDACRWMLGVAGNHDSFAGQTTVGAASAALGRPSLQLLDGTIAEPDGLKVGGISGVIGAPDGPWSRKESDFCATTANLARHALDVLVCHDGPNGDLPHQPGWPSVRRVLAAAPPILVIRGHDPWSPPLAHLDNGTQVLNVEGRVVVLSRRPSTSPLYARGKVEEGG
jgi:Icc protein